MVFQPEQISYDAGVYQLETTDPVQGGLGGVSNTPLLNLANRTAWLRQQINLLSSGADIPSTVAPLNGPAFTGSPTSPNVAAGDNSTKIANTNFVQTRHGGLAVVSITQVTTTLVQTQWGVGILVCQGILTANSTVLFPQGLTGAWTVANLTTGPFTLTCQVPGNTAGPALPQGGSLGVYSDGSRMWAQNLILTGTGEVKTADLAVTGVAAGTYSATNLTVGVDGRISAATSGTIGTGGLTATGVGAGSYTKTNLTVGIDGRITVAGSGVVTLAEVIAALGYTPVQKGTGANQLTNLIKIGWSAAGKLRLTVDTSDQGNIAMETWTAANFLTVVNPQTITGQVVAGGNITSLTRLRAALGARGSGDQAAAAILSDFVSDKSNASYFYEVLPDNSVIQAYTATNSTGADFITFPNPFPNTCVEVVACEGAPQGWGGTAPTIMGTQQPGPAGFALYVCKWGIVPGAWAHSGGITYRYIAVGW